MIVADLAEAHELLESDPGVCAVTLGGDVVTLGTASGGTGAAPSLIEQHAAIAETEAGIREAEAALDALRLESAELTAKLLEAEKAAELALHRLHDSDARISAVAERLAQLGSLLRQGQDERERLEQQIAVAQEKLEVDQERMDELNHRLAMAHEGTDEERNRRTTSARNWLPRPRRAAKRSWTHAWRCAVPRNAPTG